MDLINYPTNTIHAVYGMMSMNNNIIDETNNKYYAVKKNRKKIFLFPKNASIPIRLEDVVAFFKNYPETSRIALHYLTEDNFTNLRASLKNLGCKTSKSKSSLLVSVIDEEFFELKGKKLREIKETRNSLNKEFYFKVNEPLPDIQENISNLLKWWDKNRGEKYGWQKHSGYDKAFFSKWYEPNIDDLICLTFYNKETNELIGYSVVSKHLFVDQNNYNHVTYLIRKCNTDRRNTTLFIDYKTFEYINETVNVGPKFYVNWGASSGGVLKYKKKFPVAVEKNAYFLSINRKALLPDE